MVRESFVLPGIFLTVTLLGGFRVADGARLVPPTTMALALGLLLLGCLARARVVMPERLMNSSRSPAANLSGLVVLLSLFAACAQVFNLVTPETGFLYIIFSVFFLVQLLTTLAAVRDRTALLRSLTVLLGAAFLIRFVALDSLYAPQGGLLKRVMTALMEGITLGGLDYSANAPATGYVAFFTLTIFMIGLVLANVETNEPGEGLQKWTDDNLVRAGAILVIAAASLAGCRDAMPVNAAPGSTPTSGGEGGDVAGARAAALREAALASARVWHPPAVPVGQAKLGENPEGSWRSTDDVECRFVEEAVGGTTPKFNCQLPGGEVVKIKYGRNNPELFVEVAATRLLAALGFGADRMYVVRSVRCAGCPPSPFRALRCFAKTGIRSCFAGGLDYTRHVDFRHAVIERRLDGRRIEAFADQGWAWFEIDKIDPARGGASRAEVDAFRLMAVFLAHWDNKAANQRLICPPEAEVPDGSCTQPLAIMQDLGATFGPTKLDLNNWQRTPIWSDARECRVSMKNLPWGGATFPEARISEEGRQLLLGLLEQLTRSQLEALFESSGMTAFDSVNVQGRRPMAWLRAFEERVRQIRDGGPCRSAAALSSPPAR